MAPASTATSEVMATATETPDRVLMTENGDRIPGTIHLIDINHTLLARHASTGQHDIVLVPSPSDDPEDPLNWPPRRKLLSSVCLNLQVQLAIAVAPICV